MDAKGKRQVREEYYQEAMVGRRLKSTDLDLA